VFVIGDGIAGCLAALAARKRRADVIIVEKSQPTFPMATGCSAEALRGEWPERRTGHNGSRVE